MKQKQEQSKQKEPIVPPPMFRLSEVAAMLGLHPKTIYQWVRVGKVKAVASPGGMLRIRGEDARDLCVKSGMPIPDRVAFIPRKVVIVADESAMKMAKRSLRGKGFEVFVSQNVYQSFVQVVKDPPEYLVLDPYVQGIDAMSMIAAVRTDERCKCIKVVAWTTPETAEKKRRLENMGFFAIVDRGDVMGMVNKL